MLSASLVGYIPSPPANGISIGSVRLHVYGLMIALGILAAVWLAQRQWTRMGGADGVMASLAVWGVPGGLIGARVYSLATSWDADTQGHVIKAFEVWDGGLGIWGGVIGGVATGLYGARRKGLPFRPLLDCVASAFPLAEAIGRIGNYFNQELYGWHSSLPWAVYIDDPTSPSGVPLRGHTYQPCFLYELIWDLLVAALVLYVGRRFRLRRGYLFAVYAAAYTFGRFFIEYMRIDEAHRFFGLRLNDWSSIIVCVVAVFLLLLRGIHPRGDDLAGAPLDRHRPHEPDAVPVPVGAPEDPDLQGNDEAGEPPGDATG